MRSQDANDEWEQFNDLLLYVISLIIIFNPKIKCIKIHTSQRPCVETGMKIDALMSSRSSTQLLTLTSKIHVIL